MRIGVIGINHKLANLKLRETFAKICSQRFTPGLSAHPGHTILLLSTCNRCEVYFSSKNLAETHSYIIQILKQGLKSVEETFDQKLYSYFGYDCFNHLSRVTTGLDSAIAAETEIQGQVRLAYEHALKHLHLPSALHDLFQNALKIGKRTRTKIPLGRGMPDLEHAVFSTAVHVFEKPESKKLLVVGASSITQKILPYLKSKNIEQITICNRSLDTAKKFAQKYQMQTLEWEKIDQWSDFDWVIFATKSPKYLISLQDIAKKTVNRKLIIDLCVPRNVDPRLGKNPHITLLNIDQINRMLNLRKRRMTHLLTQAEDMVKNSIYRQFNILKEKEQKRALYIQRKNFVA